MNLYHATKQWAERPPDERFKSLSELHAAVSDHRARATEKTLEYRALHVEADGPEVMLCGTNGARARMTGWAFGQLAARAGAPAGYLRTLPAPLATLNLAHGLSARQDDERAKLLIHRNGSNLVRCFTSEGYGRIWDADISERLRELESIGPWQPAPAAFDGSRGLYASDHDLFCFMVDNNRRIFEHEPGGGLSRGFFVWNSEVGARKFGILKFLYEWVCGNHRVVGATEVEELTIIHRGQYAESKARAALIGRLKRYSEESASTDENMIRDARTIVLGDDKDQVLNRIFGLRINGLTRKVVGAAYDRAALPESRERYGAPETAWGFTGGLTEVARDLPYADERNALDRAAGKILGAVSGKLARIAA